MHYLPQSLVQALIRNRDVICSQYYEAAVHERDLAQGAIPPPLLDVIDAVIACLRPLPSHANPLVIRRADYHVLAAKLLGLGDSTEARDVRAFVTELFASFTEFGVILAEHEAKP